MKIMLHLFPLDGTDEITNASLYLHWYNNEIVYADAPRGTTPVVFS